MTRIALVRPGSTDFDRQGRITGTLDIPLDEAGLEQAALAAESLEGEALAAVYCSPCEAAQETAAFVGKAHGLKPKTLDKLRNLDQGLWQGMRTDDVKRKHPKVFRQWRERPESVCPPEGEMLSDALARIEPVLAKLTKKHKTGVIAIVVPKPLATLIQCHLDDCEIADLWKAEQPCGSWTMIDVPTAVTAGGR
jgi:broad specificity phosphatase PhoE